MATRTYQAEIEHDPATGHYGITFPAFSGVTSMASTLAEVASQASDALASAVEFMEEEGMPLPASVEDGAVETVAGGWLLVPVEAQGRAVRVQISMEEGLLARLDAAAKQAGMSRSAMIARGVRGAISEARG